MVNGDAPELLDRRHVAMGCESRETVCVDSEESILSRIDSSFRFLGAYRVTSVSVDRVPASEGSSELCAGLPRDLDRDALPPSSRSAACLERDGNG